MLERLPRSIALLPLLALLAGGCPTPPQQLPQPPQPPPATPPPSSAEQDREAKREAEDAARAQPQRPQEQQRPQEEPAQQRREATQPPQQPPATSGAGRTDDESVEALEGELARSLGEFDGRLAREREEIDQRSAAAAEAAEARRREGGAGGEDGSGGGRSPGSWDSDGRYPSGAGGSEEGTDEFGRPAAPPMPSRRAGSETDEEGGATSSDGSPRRDSIGGDQADLPQNTPRDVGDGRDDDIVARQLREAAEKEADPKLREKLWDEYRAYKRGTR